MTTMAAALASAPATKWFFGGGGVGAVARFDLGAAASEAQQRTRSRPRRKLRAANIVKRVLS